MFHVRDNTALLDQGKKKLFHTFVAKLLYLVKRTRPDISISVAFLTTRVHHPDEDDWNKLLRCIRYLRSSSDIILTLSVDGFPMNKWWVDVSYAPHQDCRSHTGGVVTLGSGDIGVHSVKQKIKTKSSTEAELVGVDDMTPHIIWTRDFLRCQGFGHVETVVYQDNRSAIILETNGQASVVNRSKHIAVRYFFIRYRVKNGELRIEWCPTNKMLEYFCTKPLQGEEFFKFRKAIMNLS